MGEVNEQTIVISDILSFLSCKITFFPKEKLLKILGDFYSEREISEGHKTLLASLPVKKSTRHGRRVKNPDPLIAMYDCFQLIPKEDLPTFVCKNLNNIPESDIVKSEPTEANDGYETDEGMDLEEDGEISTSLMEEQSMLKSQISDINSVIKKLKDDLEAFTKQPPSQKEKSTNEVESKSNKNVNSKHSEKTTNSAPNKKKQGLAFLQSLIDEDEVKSDAEDSDVSMEDSNILELEELDAEVEDDNLNAEILLNEDQQDTLEDAKSPFSKNDDNIQSQRVIFIKNEENEDSIEISSSGDYFRGFEDAHPSNMISLELSNEEEEDFKGAIELLVNDDRDGGGASGFIREGGGSGALKTCSICGEFFSTQKKLDIHVKSHCVKKIFDCILCDEGFLSKEMLRNHFEVCLEVTKKKYNLDAFPCPTCGRLYAQERALKQHSYMHSESRPFACGQCTYRYLTKNSLDAHVKTQHNVMNKFFCPFCDNSYISVGFLKNHIRSHTGERPFGCKECGYKASTADLLKRHMMTHGPPKEFKCDACDFTCLSIGKLSRHKAKEHKRENIFCTICGKEFNNSCVYHKHYMSHVGARPYPCSVCSYAAISKEVLMVHMRTHTGDNIINCPNCSVPFGTKYSLKRHLKSYCVNRSYFGTEYEI